MAIPVSAQLPGKTSIPSAVSTAPGTKWEFTRRLNTLCTFQWNRIPGTASIWPMLCILRRFSATA